MASIARRPRGAFVSRQINDQGPIKLMAYHAKYLAHDLTKQSPPVAEDQLSMSLFDASAELNPDQTEAVKFALRSPLSEGAILADEVRFGKRPALYALII